MSIATSFEAEVFGGKGTSYRTCTAEGNPDGICARSDARSVLLREAEVARVAQVPADHAREGGVVAEAEDAARLRALVVLHHLHAPVRCDPAEQPARERGRVRVPDRPFGDRERLVLAHGEVGVEAAQPGEVG